MWSVFRVSDRVALESGGPATPRPRWRTCPSRRRARASSLGGCYDLQGMRADADYMFWWVAPTSDDLQDMYTRFRRIRLGRRQRAGVVGDGVASSGRVQQEPHTRVRSGGGAARVRQRVPVCPLVRVVPARPRGAPPDARRARHDGPGLPRCQGQHRPVFLAQRLRVDPRLRGRRAVPDRGPDASPARFGRPQAHPGRDPVLHRPPQARRTSSSPAWRNVGACQRICG